MGWLGSSCSLIQVDSEDATLLFLLGKITSQHLKNAQEAEAHIDIPDVEILDRIFTVRVMPPGFPLATADADDNIF